MGLFEHFPYSNFHQLNIDWVLEKVKYCLAQVEAFATRLDNAEDDIADLQSAVSNLQTALEALRTNLQNQINALGSRVTVNESNIATLQADLENAERNIISLVGDLAQLGETVDLMGVHLANVDTAIDGLTTRVTTAESSITQLLADVASLDGRMDTAEGGITQLQTATQSLMNGDVLTDPTQYMGATDAAQVSEMKITAAGPLLSVYLYFTMPADATSFGFTIPAALDNKYKPAKDTRLGVYAVEQAETSQNPGPVAWARVSQSNAYGPLTVITTGTLTAGNRYKIIWTCAHM